METILIIAIAVMVIVTFVSVIPFVPGPMLVWGIGLVAAFLTGFDRVTVAANVIMFVLMLIGTFQEYWLPLFGIRAEGLSCLGAIGSIVGGIAGTFIIPIPILGTVIGSVLGTLIIEYARIKEMQHAVRAGKTALKLYLWGVVVEFCFSVLIIAVFIFSIISTRPL
ncbi:MAG: DUF456 domain-containing protein [Anaerolineae bacterium]|nr:DUF456 domain-containing protein [Anaerolineae bacterium]